MVTAVIVGGGKGKRMGAGINKQYIMLGGRTIIERTLKAFNVCPCIDEIVLVLPENEIYNFKCNVQENNMITKLKCIVPGGEERQDSVYNGLMQCNEKSEVVLIHDGARPFVTEKEIKNVIDGVLKYGACTSAVKVKDTIKTADSKGFCRETLNRNVLSAVQTPQGFSYEIIMKAHKNAIKNNIRATDDASLVEQLGYSVKLVEGSYYNIKITTPEDLVFGEAIAKKMEDKDEDRSWI